MVKKTKQKINNKDINSDISAEVPVNDDKVWVVSVVTTFYNAEKYIMAAVKSVTKQIHNGKHKFKIDYTIVDDKSPDGSRKLIEDYINSEEGKSLTDIEFNIYEPDVNLGCGGARRFGIEHAKGDLYMFLDADDYYINNDFIQRAVDTLIDENADVVEYGLVFNTPGKEPQRTCIDKKYVFENNPILAEINMFKNNVIRFNVWTKIYRRHIVESFRYSVERTYEDVRTTPIWIWNAKKIVIMPSCEINYRAATGSIIREDVLKTRLGTIRAIADNFKIFKASRDIIKAMYTRAMVDLTAVMDGHTSDDPGFNEMSELNTYMLSFIYPDDYKERTAEAPYDYNDYDNYQ